MVRRLIHCGIAAAFLLSGAAQAQDYSLGLRSSLDAPDSPEEIDITAAGPTTLEANPPVEPPPEPVRKRRAEGDPYAALGLDMGGLTLFPVLRAGVIASDNPAASDSDRKGDIGIRLRPSLRITSDWVRHELVIAGDGDFIAYEDQSENDSNDASVLSRLRLDVRRSTTLVLDAAYELSQESGADSEVPNTAIGNRTDQSISQNIALTHRAGRIATTAKAGSDWQYYGDVDLAGGGKEDNSDRDYVQPLAGLRVGYEASPAFQPFVEAAYEPRIHFKKRDRNGLERSSEGYRLGAGVAFEPSPIWSGELALVYSLRDYEDPELETLDVFGLAGRVTWRPSELTTLDLILGTDLNETASADSSGARTYDAALDIAHDLRDNLTISAGGGVTYEKYQGTGETELTLRSNAGLLWRMNRWLAWTLDYDLTYNDSNLPGNDYYENRVTAGIEVRR